MDATDAISDPTLPAKRLTWAAIGSEYYVVHFERGGIAHTFHILVAKLTKGDSQPKVVWRAVGGPFENYAAFLDALRSGKLDDRLGNSKFWRNLRASIARLTLASETSSQSKVLCPSMEKRR